MKVPLAWLRDFIDLGDRSVDEIVDRLALLGFPVDDVDRRTPLSGVVIGKIAALEKHPNADRLQVCTIDVGGTQTLTIATAATNVAEGQTIPVATIGAKLVGLEIAPRKMRGIESQGMLCSAGEIGLPEAWFEDGILQLDDGLELGADFVATYGLNEPVLDVEVTSNRVDAMSVLGIARELGAAYGLPVREPRRHRAWAAPDEVRVSLDGREAAFGDATIVLESPDCRRFVAQRFSGTSGGLAPFWMRSRLALAGQRPIDRLVDVSNYVMFELGQPLHFYDFAEIGEGRLVVRDAREGETIATLDGVSRRLGPLALVIADGDRAQCLAGLMGGSTSEVSATTSELLLEAATFNGPRIRRMSAALGLRTEASSRHEKGLPLGVAETAAARAAYLLESFGAKASAAFAAGETPAPPAPIVLAGERVRALLGFAVNDDEIAASLGALGFAVERDDEGRFSVVAPPFRNDVRIAEDVIEEVARVVGYDRIVAEQPPVFEQQISSAIYESEGRLAAAIAAQGYHEVLSLSLEPASVRERFERAGIETGAPSVEVRNPLSEDQRRLRFSLLPALLALVEKHEHGYDASELRLFEIGHVFAHGDDEPLETACVAWLLAAPPTPDEPAWRDAGFLRFKGECEAIVRAYCGREPTAVSARANGLHPGKTAALLVDGKDALTVGALDPRLRAAYGLTSNVYVALARTSDLPVYALPRYAAPSKYPPVERHLAVVVAAQTPALDIEHAVRAGAGDVVASVRVFDEYRGPQIEPGKKSVAVKFVLQRRDATLTDAEAAGYVERIVASLRERTGAQVRE